MPKAEEYRQYAAECVRAACDAIQPQDKLLLLQMAERWRDLASKEANKESADAASELGPPHPRRA